MPSTTRRPHTKSRHGCQQCKKNRTKCDEQRPSCSRCTRTGAKCSLLDPSSALIIINDKTTQALSQATHSESSLPMSKPTQPAETSPTSQSMPSAPPLLQQPGLLSPVSTSNQSDGNSEQLQSASPSIDQGFPIEESEVDRLRLLHHYKQSTANSILDLTVGSADGQHLWQVSIPELAFKHDYVLHGLLSISALHLALLDPSTDRVNGILAVQHHIAGIKIFTPLLQAVTEENIDALFAFACLTSIYSFGIHLRGDLEMSPLAKIREVFLMFRGSSSIVHSGRQWLANGIWGPWFFSPQTWDESGAMPQGIEDMVKKLQSKVNSTITTTANSEMYFRTIGILRQNFWHARRQPRTQLAISMLPLLSPPEFFQMVCIGEPLALSILANWAIILHWFRKHIWLQNWGSLIVGAVREVLLPEWHDCIQWATQEIDETKVLDGLPTPDKV